MINILGEKVNLDALDVWVSNKLEAARLEGARMGFEAARELIASEDEELDIREKYETFQDFAKTMGEK